MSPNGTRPSACNVVEHIVEYVFLILSGVVIFNYLSFADVIQNGRGDLDKSHGTSVGVGVGVGVDLGALNPLRPRQHGRH